MLLNEIHFHKGLHDKHLFVRKNKLISKAKFESACATSYYVFALSDKRVSSPYLTVADCSAIASTQTCEDSL